MSYTGEKEAVEFIKKYAPLTPREDYKEKLVKMCGNVDVATTAADTEEKQALQYAVYVNNAIGLASDLLENGLLTDEILAEVRALPSKAEAESAIKKFTDAREKTREELIEGQKKFAEESKELDVFKGVVFGDSIESAREKVEAYDQQVAQQMAQQ